MGIDSTLKRNLISQYGLQIAKYIIPLISLFYLARVLGADTYGYRAYVLSVMSMLQIVADFGFEQSATKRIVEAENESSLIKVVSETIFSKLLLLLLMAATLCFLSFTMQMLQRNLVFVALSFLALCFNSTLPDFVFMGKEDMPVITYRYVGSKSVFILLIILLISSDDDLVLLGILDLLTSLIAFTWTWRAAHKKYRARIVLVRFNAVWKALKKSALYFVSKAANVLYTSLTTVMIGAIILDSTQIAWWSVSVTIVGACQALFTPINNSLYPRIIQTKDLRLVKRFLFFGAPISTCMTIGVAIMSPLLMNFVGGDDYVGGSHILSILALLIVLGYLVILFGWPSLGALGKVKELTTTTTTAALFHIAGLFILWLCGQFSLVAVAVLRVCTELTMAVSRVVCVRRLIKSRQLEGKEIW